MDRRWDFAGEGENGVEEWARAGERDRDE